MLHIGKLLESQKCGAEKEYVKKTSHQASNEKWSIDTAPNRTTGGAQS